MKANKTVIGSLSKCYAVSPLTYNGKDYLIVAAEKQDPCFVYDLYGAKHSTVWNEPGGTMSIVQVPHSNGVFLATHRFYSPNDSEQAAIVRVKPETEGAEGVQWNIRTLLHLPFLHRFDIIEYKGIRWLFMCTLKSRHLHKDDWSSPGKVYACVLPDDADAEYTGGHSLNVRIIKEGLTKNHGYTRDVHNGVQTGIVCSDEGVFRFTPPETASGEWGCEKLIDSPASDALLADLKGTGEKSLLVIESFHGGSIAVYEEVNGKRHKVYDYPEPVEFAHAITGGTVFGKNYIFIGHRKGKRRLLAFHYDAECGSYTAEILDENAGAANAHFFERNGEAVLAVTNREINEIALYTFTQ